MNESDIKAFQSQLKCSYLTFRSQHFATVRLQLPSRLRPLKQNEFDPTFTSSPSALKSFKYVR